MENPISGKQISAELLISVYRFYRALYAYKINQPPFRAIPWLEMTAVLGHAGLDRGPLLSINIKFNVTSS